MGERLDVLRLGRQPFAETYELQQELLAKRIEGEVPDTLILVEHDRVVTLGRKSEASEADGLSVPVFQVERGGETTYHGPGQVVAYPIFALPEGRRDLHRYMRDLEEVVIRVLAEVEVEGTRRDGLTGVWIGDRKVCSVGVAVRRWVTWHGLSLNVHTDLGDFRMIRPCGLDAEVMTRVADHAELPPVNLLFEVLLVKHFLEVFGLELPDPPEAPPGPFPELPVLPS